MTLVNQQLQLHRFMLLVMICSTDFRKFSKAGAVPNKPQTLIVLSAYPY
jgi:hypothetical protein